MQTAKQSACLVDQLKPKLIHRTRVVEGAV